MEEVKGEYDDSSAIDDNQTQVAAAEAMMQLGNFAYYTASGSGMWNLCQIGTTSEFVTGLELNRKPGGTVSCCQIGKKKKTVKAR